MLRSVRELAAGNAGLGARSARIESGAWDLLSGLDAQRAREEALRGSSASACAGAAETEERTIATAKEMEKKAEALAEARDAAQDTEMKVRKQSRGMRGGRLAGRWRRGHGGRRRHHGRSKHCGNCN